MEILNQQFPNRLEEELEYYYVKLKESESEDKLADYLNKNNVEFELINQITI
jgi:hypothetical protein